MKKNPPRSRTKRPTVTLDLKAKEVKNDNSADQSGKSAASGSGKGKSDHSASSTDKKARSGSSSTGAKQAADKSASSASSGSPSRKTDKGQTASGKRDVKKDTPKMGGSGKKTPPGGSAKTPPPPSSGGGGGFFSHLLSSVIGAVLGIFGLTYANNQNLLPTGLQLRGGSQVSEQIDRLAGKLNALEKKTVSSDVNSMSNRLAHLTNSLNKTQKGLGDDAQGGPSLAQKVADIRSTLANLEQAAMTGKGGKLAGLTAMTKQLASSNKQSLALKTEMIKVREEQNSFRQDLTTIRGAQADFISSNAKIANELASLKNANAKIAANASRPPDVSAQIDPVLSKLGELTGKIDGVMNREASSKAEGRNIALALALGELKRAVNEGAPFETELARVAPHAPKSLDLTVLSQNARAGLVPRSKLASTYASYSQKALASEHKVTSGSFVDQMLSSAKGMVNVRPSGLVKGENTGAVLSRMDYKLARDDLSGVLSESKALQGKAKEALQPWLDLAGSRLGGDTILRSLEDKIRNALAGSVPQ